MSRRWFVGWLALILGCLTFNVGPATAAPQGVPEPGDDAALGTFLEDFYELRKATTAAVAIGYFDADDASSIHYGRMDIENDVPADENSVFEWGSVTKALVWVAMMQLAEEGRLDLEAPASDYIEGTGLSYERPFTIQNIMDHQAGFEEHKYPPQTANLDELLPLDEALLKFQTPQIYEPGTVTAYSNYSSALGGFIVEQIAGQPFYEYVQTEIFDPLGMEDTAAAPDWHDNPTVAERRLTNKSYAIAQGYDERFGAALQYVHLYPAGSAAGTLADFITFGQALLPGSEGSRALFDDPETLTTLLSGSTRFAGTDVIQNSHGLWSLPYGTGLLGHAGNTDGYSSTLFIEPDSGRGIAVLTNEAGETSYTYGLLQEFFGDYEPGNDLPKTEPTTELPGVYTNARMEFPRGSGRFLKYMGGFLPILEGDEPGQYRVAIGSIPIRHVGGDAYTMETPDAARTLMVMADHQGKTTVQSYTGDMLKESTLSFVAHLLSVLLFFVMSVVSLIALVVGLIRKLIRAARRGRETEAAKTRSPIPVSTLMFHLVQVVLAVAVVMLLAAIGNDEGLARTLTWIVGGVTLVLVGVWAIDPIRRQRPSILATLILLISVGNVLYWQWFLP